MSETTPEQGQSNATADVAAPETETSPGTGSTQDAAPTDASQSSEVIGETPDGGGTSEDAATE